MDQRLRDARGIVRTAAVEPLIALLLDDETPWTDDKNLQDLFRAWLRALVVAGTPARHPLRLRLRDQLAAACAAADRRLASEHEAAAAARAALSAEEIEDERKHEERQQALLARIGYPPGAAYVRRSLARSPTR
jgi:hypothetical protein